VRCGGPALIQRRGRQESVIQARRRAYADVYRPAHPVLRERRFHRVDGNRRPAEIQKDIDRHPGARPVAD